MNFLLSAKIQQKNDTSKLFFNKSVIRIASQYQKSLCRPPFLSEIYGFYSFFGAEKQKNMQKFCGFAKVCELCSRKTEHISHYY